MTTSPVLLWTGSIVVALLLAAGAFVAIKGLGAVLRKQWRGGLSVLLGLAFFALAVLLLTGVAFLAGPAQLDGTKFPPEAKARILAENIADLMNRSVWGVPLGFVFGIGAAFREWRAARGARMGQAPRE